VDRELEGLEGQLPADVEVLKSDVDEKPELVERYDVFSIPRMMLVRDGNILDEEVGYLSGNQILGWIDGYRGGDSAN
jgi:thioredoxin 1